ncbi:MAG: hypothetical protein QNJ55_35490 [Xenococcus sp. MO_188.B8]|nr:hypothetical protein [Xenococcus sp. MO_188.B8]
MMKYGLRPAIIRHWDWDWDWDNTFSLLCPTSENLTRSHPTSNNSVMHDLPDGRLRISLTHPKRFQAPFLTKLLF